MTNWIKPSFGTGSILRAFGRANGGATAIEYALIAGLLSIVIVVSVDNVGSELVGIFQTIQSGF